MRSQKSKMPKPQRPADDAAIKTEIELIRSLAVGDLRVLYRTTFRSAPPKALTKDLVARMIAWRIQEQAYGGHDRATLKLLDSYARGKPASGKGARRLKPGTVLVREYQGERHTVTIMPDGFMWREQTYQSLSGIARAINRFNRWFRRGIWKRIFDTLASKSRDSPHLIDSMIVKARRADGKGRPPLSFTVTAEQFTIARSWEKCLTLPDRR